MKAGSVLTAAAWNEFILKDTLDERAFPHRGGQKRVGGGGIYDRLCKGPRRDESCNLVVSKLVICRHGSKWPLLAARGQILGKENTVLWKWARRGQSHEEPVLCPDDFEGNFNIPLGVLYLVFVWFAWFSHEQYKSERRDWFHMKALLAPCYCSLEHQKQVSLYSNRTHWLQLPLGCFYGWKPTL